MIEEKWSQKMKTDNIGLCYKKKFQTQTSNNGFVSNKGVFMANFANAKFTTEKGL